MAGEHKASFMLKPPHFVLQSDWNEAFAAEKPELAWLHVSQKNEPTQFLKLNVVDKRPSATDGKSPAVQCTDSTISGYMMSKNILALSKPVVGNKPALTCYFQAAGATLDDLHKHSIYTFDINNEGMGVSSSSDGKLLCWHVANREFKKPLHGHVADVYVCRFLPSGLTVLSGGADMMLKIWLVETGECVQTIIGHTAAINDIGVIERGRNFLTCSKDGTCRLWDCGSAKCITEFGRCGSAYINTLCVRSEGTFDTSIRPGPDTFEYGTSNKIVTLGYEDGHLRNYALVDRKMTFQLKFNSPVNTVLDLGANFLVCGTDKGQLISCDVRQANYPVCISEEDRGAVLSMAKFQNGYFASFGDGTVCYKRADPAQNQSCPILELTGPNLDPVYRIVCKNDAVYTCSRDAKVRKYKLTSLTAKGVFNEP